MFYVHMAEIKLLEWILTFLCFLCTVVIVWLCYPSNITAWKTYELFFLLLLLFPSFPGFRCFNSEKGSWTCLCSCKWEQCETFNKRVNWLFGSKWSGIQGRSYSKNMLHCSKVSYIVNDSKIGILFPLETPNWVFVMYACYVLDWS